MRCAEDFGCLGDGVKVDTTPLSSAIAYGDALLLKSGATYVVDSSLNIQGKSVNIQSDNHNPARILFKGSGFLKLMGNSLNSTLLKTNTSLFDSYIEVNSTAGFRVGNLITITTPEVNSWGFDHISNDYRKGELHKIIRIDGLKIYVHDMIWHAWIASKNVKVQQYEPISVTLKNIIFEYETPVKSNIIQILYGSNCNIDNVRILNSQTAAISLSYCYNSKVDASLIDGSNSSTAGYGVRMQCCSFTMVTRSMFFNTFKCIESSTMQGVSDYGQFPNRNLIIDRNFATGNGVLDNGSTIFDYGGRFVNTHSPSENILVSNNMVNNFHTFLTSAGIDIYAHNNKISGKMAYCFMLFYGESYRLKDNVIEGTVQNAFLYLLGNSKNIKSTVSGNIVNKLNENFILNENVDDVSGLNCHDNDLTFADANPVMYSKALIGTNDSNNLIR